LTVKACTVVLTSLCIAVTAHGQSTILNLPTSLAGYRAWWSSEVHAVSIPLSMLCAALPEQEFRRRRAEALRAHGPHAERYLRVYANPTARSTDQTPTAKAFPVGSIIAKEKLADPQAAKADGVAFMIKHPPGTFPSSGDWEFRYYPETRGASYTGCIQCHHTGATRDFVFSRLKS
jgi:hypothetical protein